MLAKLGPGSPSASLVNWASIDVSYAKATTMYLNTLIGFQPRDNGRQKPHRSIQNPESMGYKPDSGACYNEHI